METRKFRFRIIGISGAPMNLYKMLGLCPTKYQRAEIGIVMSPPGIAERMRSGSYGMVYPNF